MVICSYHKKSLKVCFFHQKIDKRCYMIVIDMDMMHKLVLNLPRVIIKHKITDAKRKYRFNLISMK